MTPLEIYALIALVVLITGLFLPLEDWYDLYHENRVDRAFIRFFVSLLCGVFWGILIFKVMWIFMIGGIKAIRDRMKKAGA